MAPLPQSSGVHSPLLSDPQHSCLPLSVGVLTSKARLLKTYHSRLALLSFSLETSALGSQPRPHGERPRVVFWPRAAALPSARGWQQRLTGERVCPLRMPAPISAAPGAGPRRTETREGTTTVAGGRGAAVSCEAAAGKAARVFSALCRQCGSKEKEKEKGSHTHHAGRGQD